jgi:hypothetical protein
MLQLAKMMVRVGLFCLVGVALLGSAYSSPLSDTHAIQKRQTVSKYMPQFLISSVSYAYFFVVVRFNVQVFVQR